MKKEALGLELIEIHRDFFEKLCETENIPIMVLTNKMDLDVGKTLGKEASTALDAWLVYANRYFHIIPNDTEPQYLGFLMLRGAMIKAGPDLSYVAMTKDIRNEFEAGEVRTDTALNSYTDDEITIRTV